MSAFKLLYSTMLKDGKVPDKLKKPIKCFVKESSPYFLVTDDFFYVPCYFTAKAVAMCKNLSSMQGKVITIDDWKLEMVKVKSDQVFTSYAGVEIRFVVNSVKAAGASDSISLSRTPSNIYRDTEIKALINKLVAEKAVVPAAGLPAIDKMTSKGSVSAGIVKCEMKMNFKAPTPTVALAGAGKKSASKAMKPKVLGAKTKSIKKVAKVGSIAKKLIKSSPGKSGKATTGRKTVSKLDDSKPSTTNLTSMKQFNKLKAKHMAKNKKK